LLTPDLAGQAPVAYRNPKSTFRKEQTTHEHQSRYRSRLHRQGGPQQLYPEWQEHHPAVRCDNQTLQDADGNWQEKTQWHSCVAYAAGTAEYYAKIPTGAHVFLEGELVYREYERTIEIERGSVRVPWPVTEIVIDSISVLDKKNQPERKGAA
jgi:hypothetical protein